MMIRAIIAGLRISGPGFHQIVQSHRVEKAVEKSVLRCDRVDLEEHLRHSHTRKNNRDKEKTSHQILMFLHAEVDQHGDTEPEYNLKAAYNHHIDQVVDNGCTKRFIRKYSDIIIQPVKLKIQSRLPAEKRICK